jgi:hypothetical protein
VSAAESGRVGKHDGDSGDLPPTGAPASAGYTRQSRSVIVLIAAAAITWLFTLICLIGVVGDADPSGRLGFVILGVPFLAAALSTTYAARAAGSRGRIGAGAIMRAAQGSGASAHLATPDEADLDHLPDGTASLLQDMRRSYAELDVKLSDDERDTEAWQTMTQIVRSIVPTTLSTYRRVAGYDDADAEFSRAVRLLSRTFDERRAVVARTMLDGLHTETRYIEDRFLPSELTVDDRSDGQPSDQAAEGSRQADSGG